jgi:hypothetical protein
MTFTTTGGGGRHRNGGGRSGWGEKKRDCHLIRKWGESAKMRACVRACACRYSNHSYGDSFDPKNDDISHSLLQCFFIKSAPRTSSAPRDHSSGPRISINIYILCFAEHLSGTKIF